MRIAQIAPLVESVPPSKYGGTERVIAALTTELVALGHDVTLYASGDSQTDARLIALVERPLWRSNPGANELLLHLAELARVTREAGDYEIIHSHLDPLAFPFARSSRTPFIHTMHGRLDLPELQPVIREFPEMPLVSISNNQRRPLPKANWIATVYNGIPVERFPFGLGTGGYLVFVGRISPEKGVADAIDIALQAGIPLKIAARMPLQSLTNPWVARDWEYYIEHVKPRLKSSLIEFVGELDDQAKTALLKDAAALIFPINWPEPFGLTMVESLACGTPVIARAVGSVEEIIDDQRTGFLCSGVDEMVAACQYIDRIDRVACRHEAERRFSARVMTEAYVNAYRVVRREQEPILAPAPELVWPPPHPATLPV
ncbi:MAG: glycosyltransferase [Chloroflexi bacterium]|nr:glycosyltransferase [Chloroflexota bacterium]